jgi:acetyl-CoA carboxylase biotin carboxyl carrier protein
MDEASIRKYAKLMRELELTGLEITEGNTVVRLERGGSAPAAAPGAVIPLPERQAEAEKGEVIASPMVGVFYAAPAENAAPYVAVGDRVKAGDTLCIIEAMKLMNEITAEKDGVIAEVCAGNGQVVEYGTPLFRLEA